MTTTDHTGIDASGRAGLADGQDRRWVAVARILIGLAQGAALYWLYQAGDGGVESARIWPATEPTLFGPLLLIAAYLPVVLLAGVGRLRVVTLVIWGLVAAAFLALLGWHDVTRQVLGEDPFPPYLDPPLIPFAAVALFIAHHLIAPVDRERRLIASYPAYFDMAWKAGVQLALSLGFALAFFLVLNLGGALFGVIGLGFLNDLIRKAWFTIPVICVAFAVAVQLTDVRDGLIRGVRTVALMLLSWLLLVMTVLVAGFLVALPFTGLDGLWETGSATALVLAAAGALIILINTAYQDGEADNLPPAVLRIAVRVAAVLLAPLIAIAVWGLLLRIGQHGLTPDRIIAAACALVGAAYAVGYGFAALQPFWRKGDWMQPLERTNVVTAVVTVATILALFTPLADPARLSVADQMRRLESGAVAPDRFDFRFLRFDSGKVGEAALARLTRSEDTAVAAAAMRAQAVENRYDMDDVVARTRVPVIGVYPEGTSLQSGFVGPVTESDPRHGCDSAGACVATSLDLNADGQAEVLLADTYNVTLFALGDDQVWTVQGRYRPLNCSGDAIASDPRVAMREGLVRPRPARWPDLSFGARASQLSDSLQCRQDSKGTP